MNPYPPATNDVAHSPFRVMPTASGHTFLLSSEEFPLYHLHMTRFLTRFQPQDQWEAELVQRITDNEWRVNRIARLEMGLYAHGRLEFAALYAEHHPDVRALLIETHTQSAYARQLNALSVQEARLRRYVEKDLAELQKLQDDRADREGAETVLAAAASSTHSHQAPEPNTKNENGFEFSNSLSTDSPRSESELVTYINGKLTRH